MTHAQIVAALIGVTAVIAATWIPLHIYRGNRFKAASAKFKDAFYSAIQSLDKADSSLKDIIRSEFPNHERAELSRAKINLHSALRSGFAAFYGYTSDADGIRHAMLESTTLQQEDAQYMLVSCSAFIHYLLVKCENNGIKI
jgi:hypothetical protein